MKITHESFAVFMNILIRYCAYAMLVAAILCSCEPNSKESRVDGARKNCVVMHKDKDSIPVDRVNVTLETGFDGIEPVLLGYGSAGWTSVDVETNSSSGRVDEYIWLVKDSGLVISEEAFVEFNEDGIRNVTVELVPVATGFEAFSGEFGYDSLVIRYKGCVCAIPVNWKYPFISIRGVVAQIIGENG